LLRIAINQTKYIFDPAEMFSEVQLRYTVMNGIPILITYAMALYLDCSVFTRFSATMPGTLTLLVTYDYGATFFKNAQRLMGVVFGQTLPLLVMSFISIWDCESNLRFIIHLLAIFSFNFVFTFMYYSSEQWGTLGVLIVGFGCYPMFHQCDNGDVMHYKSQYKDIAQVIVAILLKMLIAQLMAPQEPRDNALASYEKLHDAIKNAYQIFLAEGEVEHPEVSLKAYRDDVKKYLGECEAILPKCDPSLQLVPGSRTPFKYELFGKSLAHLKLVLSDLDMMILAMTGHEETHAMEVKETALDRLEDAQQQDAKEEQQEALFALMSRQPSWKIIVKDVVTTLDNVLDTLMIVLAHDTEEPLTAESVDRLKGMDRVIHLDGVSEFYEEVSKAQQKEVKDDEIFNDKRTITQLKRTRLNVLINAFSLSVYHVGTITGDIFNNMIYS